MDVNSTHELTIDGERFLLDCSGAALWIDSRLSTRRLLLSDLHLGRETCLQRSGISLPLGATEATLCRMERVAEKLQAQEVWILGDLIHARSAFTKQSLDLLRSSFDALTRRMSVQLIEGNHDRTSRKILRSLSLTVHTSFVWLSPFILTHDSEPHRDAEHHVIAGHVHPGFRLPGLNETVPCFHLNGNVFTLPAFGDLTGAHRIQRPQSGKIFLKTGSSVVPWM